MFDPWVNFFFTLDKVYILDIMMTMKSNTVTTESNTDKPEKVLVVLTPTDLEYANIMVNVREADSRSAYIRKLIRADYRKHIRQQQRQAHTA